MNFLFIRHFSRRRAPGIEHKKSLIIFILGSLSALSPLSVDMYLPAFPVIAKALHTTPGALSFSLSSYFGGLALGQTLYGPMIDRFGRKKPLYIGLIIYVIGSLGCVLSPSLTLLILFRMISALGGCVATVVAVAMVRDLFAIQESSKIFSLLILVAGLSPLIAPTLGSFLANSFGWQFVFVILAFSALLMLWGAVTILPESFTGDTTVNLLPKSILHEYKNVFLHPQFSVFGLVGGIGFSNIFIFVAASPAIFFSLFHVSTYLYGIIFTLLAAGFIGATQLNTLLQSKFSNMTLLKYSLYGLGVVTLFFVLAAFFKMTTLIGSMIFLFLILACMGFISPNATMLCMAPFTKNAGRASALMSALQMLFGTLGSFSVGFLASKGIIPIIMLFFIPSLVSLLILLTLGKPFLSGQNLVECSGGSDAIALH